MSGPGEQGQQADLIRLLLDPAAYPHPAKSVRLVETHISYVFLAGRYVYKIKKPVDFGFLDYSSLGKRRHFCEEEVRLNRRLCPEIYLGVVPVAKDGPTLRIGGEGEPIEYAVAMRRLPAGRMLDRLIRSGAAGDAVIERVAQRVAAFHRGSERSAEIDAFGTPETIALNWRENFEQIQPFVGRSISQERVNDVRSFVDWFLSNERGRILERIDDGRIRDCHGDMRAESICVTNGLCIHDCIEFNARFRYGDVASEVAFLAMDLDALGRPDLGYWLIERYQIETRDDGL